MHTDARTLPNGSLLEGDLCVVGAGAAGIAIAREWIGAKRSVLLLEGGGFEYDARMQDRYRGENLGLPYYPLHQARLHYFGGTTGHWAGFCSTLDPIDFERRAWVPDSGWPFARAALDPRVAWTKIWQFSPPTRFGTRYREEIVGARNVHLYTNAVVCELPTS